MTKHRVDYLIMPRTITPLRLPDHSFTAEAELLQDTILGKVFCSRRSLNPVTRVVRKKIIDQQPLSHRSIALTAVLRKESNGNFPACRGVGTAPTIHGEPVHFTDGLLP